MKNKHIERILLLLCAALAANTARATTVVYPTGVFPTDVQNVQAAIDQGGTVLLKATDSVGNPLAFNFGPAIENVGSGVNIGNDVSLTGELVGGNRTTISGGWVPIFVFNGRNSIQGIKFDGPLAEAILIEGSAGTQIVGNEIRNVVPALLFSFTIADGIEVFPRLGRPASDISGNLVISGNTFGDLTGNFSIAIQVDRVAANVTISNNTFQLGQSPSDLGVVNSAAIACVRCHSVATISNNMIRIGPGIVFSGIVIIGSPDARYHVSGNTINTEGPFTDGIDVIGITGDPGITVAAVVEHNTINLLNTDAANGAGIGLAGTVTNSTIQGNIVTGNGPAALFALGSFAPGEQVTNNRFLVNDIASMNASFAAIFFDEQTANNIVRGQCISVIDLGVRNDISCPNPRSNAASGWSTFNARQQMLRCALQAQAGVRASISERASRR